MCSENMNDIPIRTLLVPDQGGWVAHCLDFDLRAEGLQPEEALDALEEAISEHLRQARAGRTPLFRSAPPEVLEAYAQAAQARLLATGPDHGHVEHRPLIPDSFPVSAA